MGVRYQESINQSEKRIYQTAYLQLVDQRLSFGVGGGWAVEDTYVPQDQNIILCFKGQKAIARNPDLVHQLVTNTH